MSTGSIFLRKACIKTLVPVEATPGASHQHEFNGVAALRDLFGTEKKAFRARFSIRGEEGTDCVAPVTWYDSREAHPTRTEYRLYFQGNPVMDRARAGDSMLIGFDAAGTLHCILIPAASAGGSYPSWTSFAG